MLKIGEFSKLSRVSVRMLRHYDEIGLLKPAEIDRFTDYRYYREDQLPTAGRIAALKDMGFSLADIIRILEVYLQAFEYPIEDVNAYCVMTGFNRISAEWTGGNYNLLTNILRGEWGMKGFAITDFSNNNLYMDVVQGLLAGGDAWCCNDASRWSEKLKGYENDPQVVTAMRKATQNIMFAVANSNAMNGLTLNTTVVEVRGWWQDAFLYMDIGFGILTVLFLGLSIYSGKKAKKKADT